MSLFPFLTHQTMGPTTLDFTKLKRHRENKQKDWIMLLQRGFSILSCVLQALQTHKLGRIGGHSGLEEVVQDWHDFDLE